MILDDGILHQVFHDKEEALHLLVLLIIARERMIFGHIGTRIVHVSFKELDFLRHIFANALFVSVFDECLFDESEVEGTDFPHTLCHFFAAFFESDLSGHETCFNVQDSLHLVQIDLWQMRLHLMIHSQVCASGLCCCVQQMY